MSNFKRHTQAGDYRPIPGCPCLNLVTAVIDHYKRMPEPHRLKTILLNGRHWQLFVKDMERLNDNDELAKKNAGLTIDATNGIQLHGCDVTIKRGSRFQQKEMQYEFYNVQMAQ